MDKIEHRMLCFFGIVVWCVEKRVGSYFGMSMEVGIIMLLRTICSRFLKGCCDRLTYRRDRVERDYGVNLPQTQESRRATKLDSSLQEANVRIEIMT